LNPLHDLCVLVCVLDMLIMIRVGYVPARYFGQPASDLDCVCLYGRRSKAVRGWGRPFGVGLAGRQLACRGGTPAVSHESAHV